MTVWLASMTKSTVTTIQMVRRRIERALTLVPLELEQNMILSY